MFNLSVLCRLHNCATTQSLKNVTFKIPQLRKLSCCPTWGLFHQRTLPSFSKRASNYVKLKIQYKNGQPCLSSHDLSTTTSQYSEMERLIYTGTLGRAIVGVKMFSYTSSGASLCLMPHVLFKTGLASQGLAVQAAFLAVVGLFTFVTPVLLHLLTRGYVVRLYHDTAKDAYTAVTYNVFLMEKRTAFNQRQVRIPAVSQMFTTFYAGGMGLLVNPDLFQLPCDYNHLMGYDQPFTFSEEDLERSDEG